MDYRELRLFIFSFDWFQSWNQKVDKAQKNARNDIRSPSLKLSYK